MLQISSNKNPLIKEVKALYRRKNRWKVQLYIIEGTKTIQEAILNHIEIKYIIISHSFFSSQENADFIKNINKDINMVKIMDSLFKEISAIENPQGIMAVCGFIPNNLEKTFSSKNPSLIFLDQIQDPGNMGTIIRSGDAFNIDGIILGKGCVDPYNLKVVRATMGSIFRVPIYICEDSIRYLRELKSKNIDIMVTSLEGNLLVSQKFRNGFVCVIGNEGNGVNPEIIAMANECIKIPMVGKTESLNAGVAASIIMYEAMKSRKLI